MRPHDVITSLLTGLADVFWPQDGHQASENVVGTLINCYIG